MCKILLLSEPIKDEEQKLLSKLCKKGEIFYSWKAVDFKCIVLNTGKIQEPDHRFASIACDFIIGDNYLDHLKEIQFNEKSNIITFGMGKKSAVTYTSINQKMEILETIYSLQRSFKNYFGEIIEPFEMPLKTSVFDSNSLLYGTTLGLYFGLPIEEIKQIIESANNKTKYT